MSDQSVNQSSRFIDQLLQHLPQKQNFSSSRRNRRGNKTSVLSSFLPIVLSSWAMQSNRWSFLYTYFDYGFCCNGQLVLKLCLSTESSLDVYGQGCNARQGRHFLLNLNIHNIIHVGPQNWDFSSPMSISLFIYGQIVSSLSMLGRAWFTH